MSSIPETSEITVHCPECGSQDIREKNVAYTELPVVAWEWNEEASEPRPTDYGQDASPEWEADGGYECHVCPWRGDLADLLVKRAAPQENEP